MKMRQKQIKSNSIKKLILKFESNKKQKKMNINDILPNEKIEMILTFLFDSFNPSNKSFDSNELKQRRNELNLIQIVCKQWNQTSEKIFKWNDDDIFRIYVSNEKERSLTCIESTHFIPINPSSPLFEHLCNSFELKHIESFMNKKFFDINTIHSSNIDILSSLIQNQINQIYWFDKKRIHLFNIFLSKRKDHRTGK